MPLRRFEARDQIFALVKAVTDTVLDLKVLWQGKAGQPPAADDADPQDWCRVQLLHNARPQSTISGGEGNRRFESEGILTIQLFMVSGRGLTKSDKLVERLTNSVEGKSTPNGVWFRNVRSPEIGEDGPWHQTNIIADFSYDEIR